MNIIQKYFKLKQDWYERPRVIELHKQILQLSEEEKLIFVLMGGNLNTP